MLLNPVEGLAVAYGLVVLRLHTLPLAFGKHTLTSYLASYATVSGKTYVELEELFDTIRA